MRTTVLLTVVPFVVGDDFYVIVPAKCPICEPTNPRRRIVNIQTGHFIELPTEEIARELMYFMMTLGELAEIISTL